MKKYSKFINAFIKKLYFNDGITQGELATLLGTTTTSLSGRITRYSTLEPPIFTKEKVGRKCTYYLTEHGKKYYEQELTTEDEWEQRKERISNILSNYDSSNDFSDRCGIALLKKVDIDTITKTFSFNEFKFLALTFGLLGDDMSSRNAFKYTVPDMKIKNQLAWGNNIYNKYKNMILTNLDREVIEQYIPSHSIEKDIFFRHYKH